MHHDRLIQHRHELMGFHRRINALLRFLRAEAHADTEDGVSRPSARFNAQAGIAAEKLSIGSVVFPCSLGEGGVQGFRWYSRSLLVDEDGDVANEFLDQIAPSFLEQTLVVHPIFKIKCTTRPAQVCGQAIFMDGNIHPCMEYRGMLRWV